jgi:hypothetical protein
MVVISWIQTSTLSVYTNLRGQSHDLRIPVFGHHRQRQRRRAFFLTDCGVCPQRRLLPLGWYADLREDVTNDGHNLLDPII